MIFLPRGARPGDILDPEELAREFQRANAIASQTTQWQFRDDPGNLASWPGVLEMGSHVVVMTDFVSADYQWRDGDPAAPSRMVLRGTGASRDPHPSLFQIPYNRGLAEVTKVNSSGAVVPMQCSWNSAYPELVWVIASWQYVRGLRNFGAGGGTDDTIKTSADQVRMIAQILLDGAPQVGTGPWAVPTQSTFRRRGFAGRTCRAASRWMGTVPAGAHTVRLGVGQVDRVPSDESGITAASYNFPPPYPGVCLGDRQIIVVRFALGDMLRS